MSKSRDKVECVGRQLQPLPPGIRMVLDFRTDNVVVQNDTWGFCVSQKFIVDHTPEEIVEAVKANIAKLVEVTATGKPEGVIRPMSWPRPESFA